MKPKIVITGADGFIARNLRVRLKEAGHEALALLRRDTPAEERATMLAQADVVFHLAGVNRPQDPAEFVQGNAQLTEALCRELAAGGRAPTLVLSSSTQAMLDNPYGSSKKAAEDAALAYGLTSGAAVHVFRLPNVFGKWARPNYNSAVATFCHNLARGLPISVNPQAPPLRLVHVDDVVEAFLRCLPGHPHALEPGAGLREVAPVYETTLAEVVQSLHSYAACRQTLVVPPVGTGLHRALYSTYVSYLPPEAFDYPLTKHADKRGEFVEMLRTTDCGQFSYFTAHPGVTRGEHYHHTKTEKFLVLRGTARFGFRHIVTGEVHEVICRGGEPRLVETVPGWTHDITNVGDEEMVVMLWANELFDRERPDTVAMKVRP